jgi:GTP-binding protein HflX
LTAAGTYADDKLFATLDTKTRAWNIERGLDVMLSDTVGFVRDLPHGLVASFKATLEEAVHADLLLHVLDIGHPHAQQQFRSVHEVLKEIGASGKPELLLLNKIDTDEGAEALPEWRAMNADAIAISARTGEGLVKLRQAVLQFIRGQQMRITIEVPAADGKLLSMLESRLAIRQRNYDGDRVRLSAIVGRTMLEELSRNPSVSILDAEPAGDREHAIAAQSPEPR